MSMGEMMGISRIGANPDLFDLKKNPEYTGIDFDYIASHERESTRDPNLGYTPDGTGRLHDSGITVGMGVDLARLTLKVENGNYYADDTKISKGLYDKIQPYSGHWKNNSKQPGLMGDDANNAVTHRRFKGTKDQRRNVILTPKETKELNNAKFKFVHDKIKRDYETYISGVNGTFDELPDQVKTTLLSMGWNMGENFILKGRGLFNNDTGAYQGSNQAGTISQGQNNTKYYNALVVGETTGDWNRLAKVLQQPDWTHPSRRNDEGRKLEGSL
jgi:hypothetical protein